MPRYKKVIHNIFWLLADKVFRMGISLVLGIWLARYLGLNGFGELSYAQAFTGIAATFVGFGLNPILTKDLVGRPEDRNYLLGTGFIIFLVSSIITIVLSVMLIFFLKGDNKFLCLIVVILCLSSIFRSSEVIRCWFESQIESKYIVWVDNIVFSLISLIKFAFILWDVEILGFVWLIFTEALLVFIGLSTLYVRRMGSISAWKFKFNVALEYVRDSWPLVVSAFAIGIYMKIDQIMLGQMLGLKEVGIYTAALRISEIWYFLPIIVISSFIPEIIKEKTRSEGRYLKMFQNLYNYMVLSAVALAVFVAFFSEFVVSITYGPDFLSAGSVLRIHIWTGIFVALGVISGGWFLVEGLNKYLMYRTAGGALVNVALNFFLIPRYGIDGAAYSTLIAQIFSAYIFDILNTKTKKSFFMKTKALMFGGLQK
ncbi:flippase [Polynucleobacter paneuropaeus]|nr:flippase [Polynucleobacter paneuropaeus]